MRRLMEALRSALGRPAPAPHPEYRPILDRLEVYNARLRAMDAQVDAQRKSGQDLRRRKTDQPA